MKNITAQSRLGRKEHAQTLERVIHWQPAGPNPLYHRNDLVDRPRAMGVCIPFPGILTSTFLGLDHKLETINPEP